VGALTVARQEGVAWVRLERPADGNRITLDLAQALCDAAESLAHDDETGVVVLRAAGDAFCLGLDGPAPWAWRVPWVEAVAGLAQPVIAAIQGDAFAEGCELALACDLRVAATSARFAVGHLAAGTLPMHGATQRLPRIVGRTRALDLLLTGRLVSAAEAVAMGLVSNVVAPDRLDAAVGELAATLAAKGPVALRYAKEAVLDGMDLTLGQGMRLEEDLYALLQTTADRAEGVQAFLEKRRPHFRGR